MENSSGVSEIKAWPSFESIGSVCLTGRIPRNGRHGASVRSRFQNTGARSHGLPTLDPRLFSLDLARAGTDPLVAESIVPLGAFDRSAGARAAISSSCDG